ncbi:MAG: PQQ-dependent sugar dehydrogenase [Archangium sp.]|nr:PQQ-dependent sugar dehydrogenase [Archangium sp.]
MRALAISLFAVSLLGCPAVVGEFDSGVDSGVDAGLPELDAGPFAYDARPANPTCVAPAPPPGLSTVTTQRAFPNLSFAAPLGMFQAPGEPGRIIIMERDGRLQAFPNRADAGTADVVEILDISARVNTAGEGGLLGLAFHPQWATKKEVFLSYTETGTAGPLRSIISRFKSTDSGLTFDPASEEKLLQLDQPYSNHDGGGIGFGPDGFLYIGFGDGGSGGDPQNRSQRLNTNLGKFLRIDVDVPFIEKYRIPADNPYAADDTPCNRTTPAEEQAAGVRCAEIYAVGLRNPWRWSFDTVSGELWAGDVGQGAREEVDRIVRGGNYGWKVREGFICYSPMTNCPTAGFIDPVVDYPRGDGNSITGGFVYRGTRIPQLVGRFVFGDYGSGRIWALEPDAMGGFTSRLLRASSFSIASFGQTLDGEVYVLDIASGQMHQLVPMGTVPVDTFPQRLSQTGCFEPGNVKQPVAAMIPYDLNSPFWSDGAVKERHFAIPDGAKITLGADGDFDFPNGTVVSKTFTVGGKRVETRLFMRHADGTWAGYTYEWDDAETDATLLPAAKSKQVGGQTWYYPSRAQCLQCHTAVSGRTLGPELAQLNRTIRYPIGATRNQLTVLEGLGYLTAPLAGPADTLAKLEVPSGTGALESRARSWLHSNCAGCHRAGAGQGPADFRFTRTFKETSTCNVMPDNGDLGISGARLIVPGSPMTSLVSRRIHALDAARMPPVGSLVVDTAGAALIDEWITSVTSCPP